MVLDFQTDGREDFCYFTKSEASTGTGTSPPELTRCHFLNKGIICTCVYSGNAEERIKQEAVRWSFLGADAAGCSARLRPWLHLEPDLERCGHQSSFFYLINKVFVLVFIFSSCKISSCSTGTGWWFCGRFLVIH